MCIHRCIDRTYNGIYLYEIGKFILDFQNKSNIHERPTRGKMDRNLIIA